MQNATVKQINSVIESYLTSQTMFTAYDVTKGVRSQGLHVMHADVKEALDTYNWRNRYTRTHNRNVNAFVYHEPMTNPDTYDANAIPEVSITKVNNSTSYGTIGTIGMSGTVGNTGTVSASTLLDKRGRFTVSRNFIRDAGLVPYTYVTFQTTANAIIIRKVITLDEKRATVDSKYNIRVPRHVFMNAFGKIPHEKDLKISTSKNTITITV